MQKLFLKKQSLLLLFLCNTDLCTYAKKKKDISVNEEKKELEMPATEDLMREHGLLNRVLLIYEEIIKRIDNNTDFSTTTLINAIDIIKSFIEDYHEKLEEKYIFPLFEKHKKEIKLVRTLKNQHIKGREITTQLQKIVATNKQLDQKDKKLVKNLLQKFIRMYRPHEAREDTVLFPQVRGLISKEEFEKLSELFETTEKELFGKNGFEKLLKKVEDIEKYLGIYQLDYLTYSLSRYFHHFQTTL